MSRRWPFMVGGLLTLATAASGCHGPRADYGPVPYQFSVQVTGPPEFQVYYRGQRLEWIIQDGVAPHVLATEELDSTDAGPASRPGRVAVMWGAAEVDAVELTLQCRPQPSNPSRPVAESQGFSLSGVGKLSLGGWGCTFEDGRHFSIVQ